MKLVFNIQIVTLANVSTFVNTKISSSCLARLTIITQSRFCAVKKHFLTLPTSHSRCLALFCSEDFTLTVHTCVLEEDPSCKYSHNYKKPFPDCCNQFCQSIVQLDSDFWRVLNWNKADLIVIVLALLYYGVSIRGRDLTSSLESHNFCMSPWRVPVKSQILLV